MAWPRLYKAYRKPASVEVDRIDKVVADLGPSAWTS
jgi:hypothetical protein